jgi:hypothetical protein
VIMWVPVGGNGRLGRWPGVVDRSGVAEVLALVDRGRARAELDRWHRQCRCETFIYRFKAAPMGRSRRRHGRRSRAPADAPARLCLNARMPIPIARSQVQPLQRRHYERRGLREHADEA